MYVNDVGAYFEQNYDHEVNNDGDIPHVLTYIAAKRLRKANAN
jgi:hypothetical protein